MAVNTRKTRNSGQLVTAPSPQTRAPSHTMLRAALVVLAAFVAITTLAGAIFVVPTLPPSWLRNGLIAPFADYIIPALALGVICGGSALVALAALIVRPRLGGLVSLVAGLVMIVFELVEIAVVGFTAVLYPTQPYGWLQVFYLAIGALMAGLGWLLWQRSGNAPESA